jgi:hypothetical protein
VLTLAIVRHDRGLNGWWLHLGRGLPAGGCELDSELFESRDDAVEAARSAEPDPERLRFTSRFPREGEAWPV